MISHEIKGNLARLLATENLVVEHRKIPTAQFNVDTRVLTLPLWDRATNIVYDLLVGHEVGHALFTPNEDWRDAVGCPKDYINVVEDARIEKLMKRKYPGLRKSFAGGYKELNEQDFFSIKDENLDDFSLIDRINLHFKIGASAFIPFSDEEEIFVTRTENVETFDEVLQLANDIYKFSKKELNQVEQAPEEMVAQQSSQGGGGMTQDGGDTDNANDNSNEDGNANEGSPVGNQSQQKQEGDDNGGVEEPGEEGSKTQDAFDRAAEKFTNMHSSNPIYIEIPERVVLSDYVADWTEVHNWIDNQRDAWIGDGGYARDESYQDVDNAYREFRKQSQKEVNYLVKEFECRKSADAYARAGQSKTGVLDTSKLHTYRYNEDIFKKITILPDGKNHGLIFILDWSGSMQEVLLSTVKQLLNLTAFCKKVQIPFEVYAFTNDYNCVRRASENKSEYPSHEEYFASLGCSDGKVFLHKDMFHLMNFISSRSNGKEYERMCLNLFREAYAYVRYACYPTTQGIGLSGTPLNESIIMLNYLIPEFKKKNDLQKVNVCILTDGESCQATYGRKFYDEYTDTTNVRPRRLDNNCILRDRKTGIVYPGFDGWEGNTNIFLRQVRDRNSGVNVIGFRVMGSGGLSSFVSSYGDSKYYHEVQKQWKKEKSAIIPFPQGYTALYAIANNVLDEKVEFSLETGAKKTEITKAFKKMLGKKSSNKKLLNSFITYVT